MLGIFKSKNKSSVEYSKFFPEKFYTNRLIKIDDSLEYFIKNSIIKYPTESLLVNDIDMINIDNDKFEEIAFIDSQYKLWYDVTNEIFFLLYFFGKQEDSQSIDNHEIEFNGNLYASWTGSMEIPEKELLLSIFNRQISKEADEYLFMFLDKKMMQHNYVAVVVQPSMIN